MHSSWTRALRAQGRRFAGLAVVGAMTAGSIVVPPAPIASATSATPDEVSMYTGLLNTIGAMGGLYGLDELGDALPFTSVLPTGASGIDVPGALTSIATALLPIAADPTASALDGVLDGLDGTTVGAGVTAHVAADVTGNSITFTKLELTRTTTTSLAFRSGDPADPATFDLDGGSLNVDLDLVLASAAHPLVISLDTGTLPPTVRLVNPPDASFTAALSLAASPIALRLGVLDVSAAGTVSANAAFTIDWLDPDASGAVTTQELLTSAPGDLFGVGYASSGADMALTLTASISGLSGSGSITLHDTNLADGVSAPTVSLGSLADFTNMTPQDVLAAIAQVVIGSRALQVVLGNADLPLVDQNLSELGGWSDAITKLFTENGLSLPDNPVDLQIAPETGAQCGNAVDDDADGVVDEGCPGQPGDLDAKGLGTIEGIVAELEQQLGLAAGALGLAYDPADHSVTFTISLVDEDFFQEAPAADINVADELAKAGITSLQDSGASITIDPSYSVHLTVGLDLSDAPAGTPITQRVFLVPTSGPELSLDVPVSADLHLTGRIGMLQLSLADQVTSGDGTVPLLAKRSGDTSAMLSVDLAGVGSDGRVTLQELFDGLSGVTPIAAGNTLTLTSSAVTVTGALNAAVPSLGLTASASIGSTPLASAVVTFGWPDLTVGTPTITTDTTFDDDYLAFDIDPTDPTALFTAVLQAIDAATSLLEDVGGTEIDTPLPVIGTSVKDLLDWVDTVQDAVNALSSDPSGTLELLELAIESAVAEALDGLDGVDDFVMPSVPKSTDAVFNPGGTFDLAAYQAAVSGYVDELIAFVNANAGFVTLTYTPGAAGTPGDLIMRLDIGICSDKLAYAAEGCSFEYPIEQPFDLNLGDVPGADFGGLVAAQGDGTLLLDYNVSARVDLGIELPSVAPDGADADSLPDVTGSFRPFLLDSSGVSASVAGHASGEFSATIGPFSVQAGEDDALAETGTQCDGNADDDGDGSVNDGCATVGADAEADASCANDTDDDSDTSVNDGCPAVGNPLVAEAGAVFELGNDLAGTDRAYLDAGAGESDFGDFFGGLSPSITANPAVDCDGSGTAVVACAHIPIYVQLDPSGQAFLGNLDLTVPDFDLGTATLTGDDQVLANLQTYAKGFVWDLIGQGITKFGEAVDEAVSAASYDVQVPVIGDLLDAGADVAGAFKTKITDPVGTLISDLGSSDLTTIQTTIQDFFWDNLNGGAADATDRFILNYDDPAAPPVKEEDVVVTLMCGSPAQDCITGPDAATFGIIDLVDVQVQLAIGQGGAATTPAFDWGVPGLRLSGDSTLSATVSWQVNLGFGVSLTDGFYLLSSTLMSDEVDGADIAVIADVDFGTAGAALTDPPALEGDLAFIGASLWNAKADRENAGDAGDTDGRAAHEVHLQLSVDIPDPSPTDNRIGLEDMLTSFDVRDWDLSLVGDVDVFVTLATSASVAGGSSEGTIPRLLADLSLTWGFSGTPQDGFSSDALQAGFDNVRLDLGSFISEFLSPVLENVQTYTKPLQPIIDTVNAPIPGVSQLAELVGVDPITLMDLFETVSGNDLTLIRRLLDVITLVNSIPTVAPGTPSLIIPLGGFSLDAAALTKPELPASAKGALVKNPQLSSEAAGGVIGALGTKTLGSDPSKAAAFKANLTKATTTGGFTFPAFQDPTQLFQLLVGEDVSLVEFDAGTLKAETGWSQSFGPITIGPIPVSIVVSISASIQGRFVVGFDTKGIRQLVKNVTDDDTTNDGFFDGVGVLLSGMYLSDLDKDGNDVPEIRLVLEGAVGAALDLVVVKVGIEAGLRATLDLNLHDGGFAQPVPPENLDGKLRLDEIISFINNPLCLFDVSGKLEAFIRVFVTLDFFLFSVTFKQTIVNIVLLELDDITADLCKPPPPVLATDVGGGVLRLNMGQSASVRNYAVDKVDEKFVVRQLTEGSSNATVRVSAFGIVQDYSGVNKVIGGGYTGKDTIVTENGAISGVCQPDGVTVEPPVPGYTCTGDPANPKDDATPGKTVSKQILWTIPTELCGGADDDKLGGGNGADTLVGGGLLSGTSCTIDDGAADGDDRISGQAGGDTIYGNAGDDQLNGDDGDDTVYGGPGLDQLVGGKGRDTMHGGADADSVLGGPEKDPCPNDDTDACAANTGANWVDDVLDGDGGDDSIEGDHGRDTINGGAGFDTIVGGFGNDTINGGGDADNLFGNQGDDTINGDAGDDDAYGGTGTDTINGNGDDDDLVGEAGGDIIDGGNGRDVILGDLGVINRNPDPATSTFDPVAGKQLVELTASPTPPAGGDTLSGGADPDLVWGQEGGDTVNGGGGNDVLRGNAGIDTMSGNGDADEMYGDAGDDVMYGDALVPAAAADGVDSMRGGDGNDTMSGNAKGDSMFGDAGSDTIYGDADAEDCSNDGNDTVYGGPDDDLVLGDAADDTLSGDGGDDRLIGGSNTSGTCDGNDLISGGEGGDVIAGDNATIGSGPGIAGKLVTLLLDGQGTGDHLSGGNAGDRLYGEVGDDVIDGDAGDDAVEGNQGHDTIHGGTGADDLVGGGSAADGVIDADRVGSGLQDIGDAIDGDGGNDVIAGDNALVSRVLPAAGRAVVVLFDVATTSSVPAVGSSGADTIGGGTEADIVFGQGVGDTLSGGAGNDYVEGNAGDDTIAGNDGDDDLVGGGSANDGIIDADRVGTGLSDVGETLIGGGNGEDWIAGDNALIDRNVDSAAAAPIVLFDIETTSAGALPGTGGGEALITGGDGPDWIFGQTGNDTINGNEANDYVEGNNGNDALAGNDGDDDLVGGGSANDGVIDADRVGDGLLDAGETVVTGDAGNDWITGDNALVNRNRPAAGRQPIELFDVARSGGPVIATSVSGGDLLQGGGDRDRIFGQGNGTQPAGQTDPTDGRNNDFVGSAIGSADFDRATGTADEDGVGWLGDTVLGGLGDDEIEGGAGNDLILGNGSGALGQDEDDIVGGGSADDGRISPTARLNLGANLLDGRDTIHGDNGVSNAGDDDAIEGDNGWIVRPGTKQVGASSTVGAVDQFERDARMTQVVTPAGTFGGDFISGNGGNDELFGQSGDDAVEGGWGSDAIVGDLGKVTTDLLGNGGAADLCTASALVPLGPKEPFIRENVCQPGTLFRLVQLYAFDDTTATASKGNDVLLGMDGDDWIHGGAGVDIINGDGDGGAIVTDPTYSYTTTATDPNPATPDFDRIFGGDSNGSGTVSSVTGGNGDVIWGGRGHDHTYGGRGADMLEVRPDGIYSPTWAAWGEGDVESYFGIDFVYGGYDQDMLQANIADTGPVVGDRLLDWVGVYNLFVVCPAFYGGYVPIRDQSPGMIGYLEQQATTDGGYQVTSPSSSGYRELAMVYKPDVKNNANPIYPGTPGHFSCG